MLYPFELRAPVESIGLALLPVTAQSGFVRLLCGFPLGTVPAYADFSGCQCEP